MPREYRNEEKIEEPIENIRYSSAGGFGSFLPGTYTMKEANISTDPLLYAGRPIALSKIDETASLTTKTSGHRSPIPLEGKIAIITTPVTIDSSSDDSDQWFGLGSTILALTIPGGTLGTNNGIKIRLFVSNIVDTTANEFNLYFMFGNTIMINLFFDTTAGHSGYIDCWLLANGATDAQVSSMVINLTNHSGNILHDSGTSSASLDSESDVHLEITGKWDTPHSGDSFVMTHAIIESIQ